MMWSQRGNGGMKGGSESVAGDVGDGGYRQRGDRFKEPMQGLKV